MYILANMYMGTEKQTEIIKKPVSLGDMSRGAGGVGWPPADLFYMFPDTFFGPPKHISYIKW